MTAMNTTPATGESPRPQSAPASRPPRPQPASKALRGTLAHEKNIRSAARSVAAERSHRTPDLRHFRALVRRPSGQRVLDVESHCQVDFALRMIVTAAWGSGTVIVTFRPVCRASRRAGPVRTVK